MVKRIILYAIFTVVAIAASRGSASAACTQSHVFVTGEVLTATILNANPITEIACINNIDNTNIGANGIFASQIVSTTVGQATFGGSVAYTFGHGLIINGTLTLNGSVLSFPLSIANGGTGSASKNFVDLSSVQSVGGAKTFTSAVSTSGSFNNQLVFNHTVANTFTGSEFLHFSGDTDTDDIAWYRNPSSSEAFEVFDVTASRHTLDLYSTGGMEIASGGQTTVTYVPPLYTASGTAVASTAHAVQGNTNCTIGGATTYLCSVTPTFSGAAAFASSSSYTCTASLPAPPTGSSLNVWVAYSGTSPTFTLWGSSNNSGDNFQINYICVGT